MKSYQVKIKMVANENIYSFEKAPQELVDELKEGLNDKRIFLTLSSYLRTQAFRKSAIESIAIQDDR